jgi:hypothetical protein
MAHVKVNVSEFLIAILNEQGLIPSLMSLQGGRIAFRYKPENWVKDINVQSIANVTCSEKDRGPWLQLNLNTGELITVIKKTDTELSFRHSPKKGETTTEVEILALEVLA